MPTTHVSSFNGSRPNFPQSPFTSHFPHSHSTPLSLCLMVRSPPPLQRKNVASPSKRRRRTCAHCGDVVHPSTIGRHTHTVETNLQFTHAVNVPTHFQPVNLNQPPSPLRPAEVALLALLGQNNDVDMALPPVNQPPPEPPPPPLPPPPEDIEVDVQDQPGVNPPVNIPIPPSPTTPPPLLIDSNPHQPQPLLSPLISPSSISADSVEHAALDFLNTLPLLEHSSLASSSDVMSDASSFRSIWTDPRQAYNPVDERAMFLWSLRDETPPPEALPELVLARLRKSKPLTSLSPY